MKAIKSLVILLTLLMFGSCCYFTNNRPDIKKNEQYLKWDVWDDVDNPFDADTVTVLNIENGYVNYVTSRDINLAYILSKSCSECNFKRYSKKIIE